MKAELLKPESNYGLISLISKLGNWYLSAKVKSFFKMFRSKYFTAPHDPYVKKGLEVIKTIFTVFIKTE